MRNNPFLTAELRYDKEGLLIVSSKAVVIKVQPPVVLALQIEGAVSIPNSWYVEDSQIST